MTRIATRPTALARLGLATLAVALPFLFPPGALAAPAGATMAVPFDSGSVRVTLITDEAEAALTLLRARDAKRLEAEWERLRSSDGYRRLKRREAAMGRAFTDSAFAAFVRADSTRAKAGAYAKTLEEWSSADLAGAGRRALAYLPPRSIIRAKVYLLIKPRSNSFVFDTDTDPAILLYLDPTVTPAKLENTVAHELHHIGYASACSAPADTTLAPGARAARQWLTAFGEGLAMLAAAGGPDHHPHEVSPPEERARWDRDIAHAGEDLRTLDRFLLDVATGRMSDPDSIRARGMSFFGVQGPWYTVGYMMAQSIEQMMGRDALVASICDPVSLLETYNRAFASGMTCRLAPPGWSPDLLAALRARAALRGSP
jgi:hypothetical protein